MDVGEEGTWTQLDGTHIDNTAFTLTFDKQSNPSGPQPNGGTGQNCVIINNCDYTYPRFTQDKGCHTFTTQGMICYRNTLGIKNCLTLVSTTDGKRRTHCYWVATQHPFMTSFSVTKAMEMCRRQGGTIAPIIDDEQFQFIKNITDYYRIFEPTVIIWTGTHTRGGRGQNWNGDSFNVSTTVVPLSPDIISGTPEERCLVIKPSSRASWTGCTSTTVPSVVCYRTPITLVLSTNISIQDILQEIIVNPTQTNAYRLSKISVYEDRPSAKAIGSIGIILVVGTILFIIILDCQKLDTLRTKPKRKKKKVSPAIENSNTTDTSEQVNQK